MKHPRVSGALTASFLGTLLIALGLDALFPAVLASWGTVYVLL